MALTPVPCFCDCSFSANKHKPWIETEYQGIVMENDNTVLLNPPLFALDKDAPLHYAGKDADNVTPLCVKVQARLPFQYQSFH